MGRKKSNSTRAYEYLKNEIVSLRMPQGTKIYEQEIADALGISRTPVREAIHRLESQGLLSSSPYQGTIVSVITLEDIIEICELRELIETWAIKKSLNLFREDELNELENNFKDSINNRDWELYHATDNTLHTLIIRKSGSIRAMQILEMMNSQLERFRTEVQRDFDAWNISLQEHLEIIQFIRNKDHKKCVLALAKHLGRVKSMFIEIMYSMKVSS